MPDSYLIEIVARLRDETKSGFDNIKRQMAELQAQAAAGDLSSGVSDLADESDRAAQNLDRLQRSQEAHRRATEQSTAAIKQKAIYETEGAEQVLRQHEGTALLNDELERTPQSMQGHVAAIQQGAKVTEEGTKQVLEQASAHRDTGAAMEEAKQKADELAASQKTLSDRSRQARSDFESLSNSFEKGTGDLRQLRLDLDASGKQLGSLAQQFTRLNGVTDETAKNLRGLADDARAMSRSLPQGSLSDALGFEKSQRDLENLTASWQKFRDVAATSSDQEMMRQRSRIYASRFGALARQLPLESPEHLEALGGQTAARALSTPATLTTQQKAVQRGDDLIRRMSSLDVAARARTASNRELEVAYGGVASGLRSVWKEMEVGSAEATRFGRAMQDAEKKAANIDLARSGNAFSQFARKVAGTTDSIFPKIVSLSAELRGLRLVLMAGFAQPLITGLLSLGAGFFSIASGAAQAAATIGGVFISGLGQLVPQISVAVAGLMALKNVFNAVQAAVALQQQQFLTPNQGVINQLSITNSLIEAELNLKNAYLQVKQAQEELAQSSLQITEARQALLKAEQSGSQQAIEQARLNLRAAELSHQQAQNSLVQGRAGVGVARRQITIEQLTAAQPVARESQAQATLQYMLGLLSPTEKKLYNELLRFETELRSPNSPLSKIASDFLRPFVYVGGELQKLLSNPQFLQPMEKLAQTMGKYGTKFMQTIFGSGGQKVFESLAQDATKSIPIVERALSGFAKLLGDISKAAAPAFRMLSRDWANFWNGLAAKEGSASGQKRLTEFFNQGARWAQDFAHLARSIVGLLMALGHDAAPQGMKSVTTFTGSIQAATSWVKNHGPEVTRFFHEANQGLSIIAGTLFQVGKLLVQAFSLSSLQAFSTLLTTLVLPAFKDFVTIVGTLVKWITTLLNTIAPLRTAFEVGLGLAFTLAAFGRLITIVTRVTNVIAGVKDGILALRTGEGILGRLGNAWQALTTRITLGKKAINDAKVAQEELNSVNKLGGTGGSGVGAGASESTPATFQAAADTMQTAADTMLAAAREMAVKAGVPGGGGGAGSAGATAEGDATGAATGAAVGAAKSAPEIAAEGGKLAAVVDRAAPLLDAASKVAWPLAATQAVITGITAGGSVGHRIGAAGNALAFGLPEDFLNSKAPWQSDLGVLQRQFSTEQMAVSGGDPNAPTWAATINGITTQLQAQLKTLGPQGQQHLIEATLQWAQTLQQKNPSVRQPIQQLIDNINNDFSGLSTSVPRSIDTMSSKTLAEFQKFSHRLRQMAHHTTSLTKQFITGNTGGGFTAGSTGMGEKAFASSFLRSIKAPINSTNLSALYDWWAAEEGNNVLVPGHGGLNNPFEVTYGGNVPYAGLAAGPAGAAGVKNYSTSQRGVQAAINYFLAYGTGVLQAFRQGKSISAIEGAVRALGPNAFGSDTSSPWGISKAIGGMITDHIRRMGLRHLRRKILHFASGGRAPWGGEPVPIIAHEGERISNPGQWSHIAGLAGMTPHGLDRHMGYDSGHPRQFAAGGTVPYTAAQGSTFFSPGSSSFAGINSFLQNITTNLAQIDVGSVFGSLDTISNLFRVLNEGFKRIGTLGSSSTLAQIGKLNTIINNFADPNNTSNTFDALQAAFTRFQNNLSDMITGMAYLGGLRSGGVVAHRGTRSAAQRAQGLTSAIRVGNGTITGAGDDLRLLGPQLSRSNFGTTGTTALDLLNERSLVEQNQYLDSVSKAVQDAINKVKHSMSVVNSARNRGAISSQTASKALKSLDARYTELIQRQETLGQQINSTVTQRFQTEQQYVQDLVNQINDIYQTQQSQLQGRQAGLQSLGQYGKLPRVDQAIAKSAQAQIRALQQPLRDAERQHDSTAVAQIQQQIAQLRSTVMQSTAQMVQDAYQAVEQAFAAKTAKQQSRQSIAQALGHYDVSAQIDRQIVTTTNEHIKSLQAVLKRARSSGNQQLASQVEQEISQLKATAAQSAAQAIQDQVTAITNAAQTQQAGIQSEQSIKQTLGQYQLLPAIDTAMANAVNSEIAQLKQQLTTAQQSHNTGEAQQIQQQIDQLQTTVTQMAAQAIQDQISAVEQSAQVTQAQQQSAQSTAQAMGNFAELIGPNGIDQQIIDSTNAQIAQYEAILQQAQASGNQAAVSQIQQTLAQLQETVGQTTAQLINDQISAIQQTAQTQQAQVSEYQSIAQTMESNASSPGLFAAAGAKNLQALNLNQTSLQSQIAQYNGLLGQAITSGNVGAQNTIMQQIDQLTAQLASNTQAIQDNTAQVVSETSAYIQSRGQFQTGTLSTLSQIITTIGQTTGFTNVGALKQLTSASNTSLQSTNSQLLQQLASLGGGASGLASLLGSTSSPQAFVSALSGANLTGIESGQDSTWVQTFESLLQNLEQNTEAIATNNQQLATLNGQLLQPQQWSSSAWSNFRNAIFSGMGNLLPQYQNVLTGTSALPTIAPIFNPVGGVSPTVGTLNINHAPASNLAPDLVGEQLAHAVSRALA